MKGVLAMTEDCFFTYSYYQELLRALKRFDYSFSGYEDWHDSDHPVILRHDIDFEPSKAIRMAQIECEEGAKSTYFFLLRSDFYNAFSPRTISVMNELIEMGHSVGLHFDEVAYGGGSSDIAANIQNEMTILEAILGTSRKARISAVSMHRPSQAVLEGDIEIPGVINSYSALFFTEFKYLSDSRHHWRTQPLPAIMSGEYPRLHILTHPFWYHETEWSIGESLADFVDEAALSRMLSICENLRDADQELDGPQLLSARITRASSASYDAERVTLRPLRMLDAGDMYEYASSEEACRFLRWGPYRQLEEAEAWLEGKLNEGHGGDLLLGIELKSTGKLMGVVRAYGFDAKDGEFEISYILNPAFQGHGYAAEAVKALLAMCFENLGMQRVHAYVDVDNRASQSLLSKLGFTKSLDAPQDFTVKGNIRPYERFVMTRVSE